VTTRSSPASATTSSPSRVRTASCRRTSGAVLGDQRQADRDRPQLPEPGSEGAGHRLDALNSVRQEVTLRPDVQFVTLFPGDKLAIVTKDTRVQVVLVVNEMNEAESVRWGLGHEPTATPTRFRIIRSDGGGVRARPHQRVAARLHLRFEHRGDGGRGRRHGRDPVDVALPLPAPRGLLRVAALLREQRGRQGPHRRQRDPQVVDRRDGARRRQVVEGPVHRPRRRHRARGHAAVAGQKMVCDIEVAPVTADSRLRARYLGGL
jgi:hypothetical protein